MITKKLRKVYARGALDYTRRIYLTTIPYIRLPIGYSILYISDYREIIAKKGIYSIFAPIEYEKSFNMMKVLTYSSITCNDTSEKEILLGLVDVDTLILKYINGEMNDIDDAFECMKKVLIYSRFYDEFKYRGEHTIVEYLKEYYTYSKIIYEIERKLVTRYSFGLFINIDPDQRMFLDQIHILVLSPIIKYG